MIAIILSNFSAFHPMLGKINKERELTKENSGENVEFGKTGNQAELILWHSLHFSLSC